MRVFLNHIKVQLKEGNSLTHTHTLDSSHAFCLCHNAFFIYLLFIYLFIFWFSVIMLKRDIWYVTLAFIISCFLLLSFSFDCENIYFLERPST